MKGAANRQLWLALTIVALLLNAGPLHAQDSPPSRPILFVHGWCGSAYDWAPLYSYLFQILPNSMYPNQTVYLAEYDSVANTVSFWIDNNPSLGADGVFTAVPVGSIPASARFFVIEFIDSVGYSTDPADVAKISILNKAYELSQVLSQITAITQIPKVNILAHSMGGLDARAYVENMASTGVCFDYVNNIPAYSGSCTPGSAAYVNNVANIITVDTPHAGSPLAYTNFWTTLLANAGLDACQMHSSTNKIELAPKNNSGPGLLEALNYSENAIPGFAPTDNTTPIQAIMDYLTDVQQSWDLLTGESDDVVPKNSQSIELNLPLDNSPSASLHDHPVPYLSTDSGVSATPGCWISAPGAEFQMLHSMTCLGALQPTQQAITTQLINDTVPWVSSWTVTPSTLAPGGNVTIAYTATDFAYTLSVAELWRAPADANGQPGTWAEVNSQYLSGTGPQPVTFQDQPPAVGTYWYGTHLLDVAGNQTNEPVPLPVIVTAAPTQTLTVSTTGAGTVTSSDGYISCGTNCTYAYASGAGVTLTAAPASGWTFGSWTGCDTSTGTSCTVTMTLPKTVTATFTQNAVADTLTVSGTGSGMVSSSDGHISCGANCTYAYPAGTSVTLTDVPSSGWNFSTWGGACSGATSCTVTMTSAAAVTATFTQAPGPWMQQQEVTAPDGAANDYFGWSVSVSGNTAVIGAYQKTVNSNELPSGGLFGRQGAAYVFVRSGGVWSLQQELTASDGTLGSWFGYSVSVSGDTVVIGAINAQGGQGAVYVFVRSGGVWSQQQKLTAADGANGDLFGLSASVSGNTTVIGAYGKNTYQGAAYVFVRSGTVWTLQQELTASDGAADCFGSSVSVSDDTAVIGAPNTTINSSVRQGAAYVFARNAGVWTLQQELTASDGAAGDGFGQSVSISGDTVMATDHGAAYMFTRGGGTWTQQQELSASDGVFGSGLGLVGSLSADTAVITGTISTLNSTLHADYVFVRSGGVWSQQQELTGPVGLSGWFGWSVSVSGDTALIGAEATTVGLNAGQGAAYVFTGSSTPAISGLSPASAAPNGAAFTLTVNGTSFVSGATVDWNGTALTTNFVSATQLTASVPASLITSAGMATVTVVNPGAVTSGGVGFPIQSGPAATAVSPGTGDGASQTFTFTFSDPSGYQNLGVLDVLINNYLDGIQACYIALVPSGANAGAVYLVDDGGDAGGPFAGYMALPGTGSVSNSQCTVSGTGSSVVGSGTTITLTLNIGFSASFTGNRIFYTAARETGTGNSGWQPLSTWTVPGTPATPTQATGVTPASGSGVSQSFVFTFADSAGWQDLGVVDVLFNNYLDGIQGCYIAYSVPSAALYLVDDAGDAGGPFAGYLALPGTGSMSNSQCTVSGVGSSAAGSGNTLTLTLNVSFTGAFAGNRIFYTASGNAAGTENSGWNALGAWTVP